jgi:hypothetical protein
VISCGDAHGVNALLSSEQAKVAASLAEKAMVAAVLFVALVGPASTVVCGAVASTVQV